VNQKTYNYDGFDKILKKFSHLNIYKGQTLPDIYREERLYADLICIQNETFESCLSQF